MGWSVRFSPIADIPRAPKKLAMQILVAGHTLNFLDCCEIGQGGPEACSLSLDGFPIPKWSFDPSPLEYRGTILIPVRKGGFWELGYALARIDPSTRKVSVISKVRGYMKLLRVEGNTVVFATTTYGPETGSLDLS
jgi:hypothetical protein